MWHGVSSILSSDAYARVSELVRACRHAYHANLLGVIATLLGLASHHAHGALTVFPRRLVYGQSLWAWRAVDEPHALYAFLGEPLPPLLFRGLAREIFIRSSPYENHAGSRALPFSRSVVPFEIRQAVLVGVEVFLACHAFQRGNLVLLAVGHLALWPKILFLDSGEGKRHVDGQQESQYRQLLDLFHIFYWL